MIIKILKKFFEIDIICLKEGIEMDFYAIGARIRAKRKALNLTQENLAEKLDISTEHLSRIERGSVKPSLTLTERICAELKMEEEELLFGRSSENADDNMITSIFNYLSPQKQDAIKEITKIIARL